MAKSDIVAAHGHCTRHRAELGASERCGCFYCLAVFNTGDIIRWLSEGDGTALCPRCGIDSVLGSASGYPLTPEFLGAMHRHWFGDE